MKFLPRLLVVALMAYPLTAFAERPNYNHFDAGYLRHRLGSGCVQDGLEVGGSIEVSDRVFVAGNYSSVKSSKKDKESCGSSMLRGSAGIFGDFAEDGTFYGALSGQQFSPKNGDADIGWGAEAGLRTYLARGIEGHVALGLIDVGPINEIYVSVGGIYWFDDIGVSLDISTSDDDTSGVALGARFSF